MPDHRPILTLSFRTEQADFFHPASPLRTGRPAQREISLLFAFIPSPHPHSGSDRHLFTLNEVKSPDSDRESDITLAPTVLWVGASAPT
jgi:hypothetical protein